MISLEERLKHVENCIKSNEIKIMIMGLGSVGTYLLNYLISKNDPSIKIIVVGRNIDKLEETVNIAKIAGLIREECKSEIIIEAGVDFSNINTIKEVLLKHMPTFIVNSSRAYSGLKYGSISWANLRSYGIWAPLAIKYTKNIMEACDSVGVKSIIINTSYSDAIIPWLKSAGKAYPDFGSGNLNHLIPRMKYAVADIMGISDFWNVEIMLATSHFHDVCISKEGHTEGQQIPLKVFYQGEALPISEDEIVKRCSIPMPTDATRNMMNASSNYQIIMSFIEVIRSGKDRRFFSPGALGNIGGYPVVVGYRNNVLEANIDESVFDIEEMEKANRESIYLDGIEDIRDGKLFYTDELIKKTAKAFNVELPKVVAFDDIEKTANYIIDRIINPTLQK